MNCLLNGHFVNDKFYCFYIRVFSLLNNKLDLNHLWEILMLFRGQTIDLKFQHAINWNQLENPKKTMAPTPAIVSKEIPDIEVSEQKLLCKPKKNSNFINEYEYFVIRHFGFQRQYKADNLGNCFSYR